MVELLITLSIIDHSAQDSALNDRPCQSRARRGAGRRYKGRPAGPAGSGKNQAVTYSTYTHCSTARKQGVYGACSQQSKHRMQLQRRVRNFHQQGSFNNYVGKTRYRVNRIEMQDLIEVQDRIEVKDGIVLHVSGNALAWVQRVHKPADLWGITFCTR